MLKLKKTLLTTGICAAFCLAGYIGIASAEQPVTAEEFNQALLALPELAEDLQKPEQNRSGGASMKCYVDTPAFDVFTTGFCADAGVARTTTAVFRIDNEPSNFTILWSDSRCSSSNDTCLLPIRHFQTINLSATVLNNDNNTFSTTSATALYESFE